MTLVSVASALLFPVLVHANESKSVFLAPSDSLQGKPNFAAHAQIEAVTDTTNLSLEIAPFDAKLGCVGRFDTSDARGPRCAWPASSVAVRFRGTALSARLSAKLSGESEVRWQIEVDGKPTQKIIVGQEEQLYDVAQDLAPGEHLVRLVQATEANVGTTQVRGFQLNAGAQLLPVATKSRRLEVIGDSISAGYGNEATSKEEHFSPDTENAYFAYGAIAARRLNADYACLAWSGKKMWPDNTLPELYDFVLPADKSGIWDFQTAPDAVVINLGTNDFAKASPEKDGWIGAYESFVERVRARYPKAMIYCAIGTMMGDWGPGDKPLSTLRAWLARVADDERARGDERVRVLDFGVQDGALGYGADWHPNVKNHQLMAEKLVQTLSDDLGWTP